MKANVRAHQRFDDEAQSVIVGAVLLTAILTGVMVTIQLSYVPIWEQDAEAALMTRVEGQFADIKSSVARQASGIGALPASDPVSLGDDRTSVFKRPGIPNTLELLPAQNGFSVASNRFLVQERNGTDTSGLDPTWTDIAGVVTVTDVASVQMLRLQVGIVDEFEAGNAVSVTVTDVNSVLVGTFTFDVEEDGAYLVLSWTVTNATGSLVSSHYDVIADELALSPYDVIVLDDQYLFRELLAGADAPLELAFLSSFDSGAAFAVSYTKLGTGGNLVRIGAGGVLDAPFSESFVSGALIYHARNLYFIDQTFYFENGGIILNQSDGAVFRVEPGFGAAVVDGTTQITFNIPALNGSAAALTGQTTATVLAHAVSRSTVVAAAPMVTLTVETEFPVLWEAFWSRHLTGAGLSKGTEYTTTIATGSASVSIFGTTADPSSIVYDLSVEYSQNLIDVSMEV